MESATVGNIEVSSSHESADEIRAALTAETRVETPPAAPTTEPETSAIETPETPAAAEPADSGYRNADGTFKRRPTNAEARRDPKARVHQQTWDQREAERRADAAERRAADLEARLRERETPPPPPPKPHSAPAPPIQADPTDPRPDKNDLATYPDGQFDERFMEDLSAWRSRQEFRRFTRAQQEQQAMAARFQELDARASKFAERMAAAFEADPQFDAKIHPAIANAKPASALSPADVARLQTLSPQERNQSAFHSFLAEQLWRSEHPKDVALYLSDPATLQRFATLHPNDVIRELAIFESRLGAAPSAASAPPVAVSSAKRPIQPLGSSPQAADPTELSDDLPIEEWIKRGNAKDRASGRR